MIEINRIIIDGNKHFDKIEYKNDCSLVYTKRFEFLDASKIQDLQLSLANVPMLTFTNDIIDTIDFSFIGQATVTNEGVVLFVKAVDIDECTAIKEMTGILFRYPSSVISYATDNTKPQYSMSVENSETGVIVWDSPWLDVAKIFEVSSVLDSKKNPNESYCKYTFQRMLTDKGKY